MEMDAEVWAGEAEAEMAAAVQAEMVASVRAYQAGHPGDLDDLVARLLVDWVGNS